MSLSKIWLLRYVKLKLLKQEIEKILFRKFTKIYKVTKSTLSLQQKLRSVINMHTCNKTLAVKRAVRFFCLRGNCLLFEYTLTVFCRGDSAWPLIGCLDMNIVCWCQCSDQSEARIPVTVRYVILTGVGPGGVTRCLTCIHQSECCIW